MFTSGRFECTIPTTNDETEYIWQERILALQGKGFSGSILDFYRSGDGLRISLKGGLIIASLFEILVGASGLVGLLLRFVGPLTVAPVLISIGISLAGPAIA